MHNDLNERWCNNLMVGNAHELRKGKEETIKAAHEILFYSSFCLFPFGVWYLSLCSSWGILVSFLFVLSWGIFHICKDKCYEDKISYNLFTTVDIASYNIYILLSHINLSLMPLLLALIYSILFSLKIETHQL